MAKCWIFIVGHLIFCILCHAQLSLAYYPGPDELCVNSRIVCEYDFKIHRIQTMTYTDTSGQRPVVYDLELDEGLLKIKDNPLYPRNNTGTLGRTIDPANLTTVDGYQRDIIVINGSFPGPTIHAMEGVTVRIRVENLLTDVTSIHWHGLYQTGTNFFDGVPYLTQCPILPHQVFTYIFKAEPAGTHWYHSHYATQRFDGLYGMFIVYPSKPEIPNYSLFVSDWYHVDSDMMEVGNAFSRNVQGSGKYQIYEPDRQRSVDRVELSNMFYVSTLLGGKGRFEANKSPLQNYLLDGGKVHLFRMAHSGAEYAYEISADQHKLKLVALDGNSIRSLQVDSFIIHPGESADFEILANQTPTRYWLRAERIDGCNNSQANCDGQEGGKAILVYRNAVGEGDPTSTKRSCSPSDRCLVFNCPYQFYPNTVAKDCISVYSASSNKTAEEIAKEYGTLEDSDGPAVTEIFLNFAFVPNDAASVNGRKFVFPRSVLLQHPNQNAIIADCSKCSSTGCSCTNMLSLDQNQVIQLVLTNYDDEDQPGYHSVHLHGHSFVVLTTGFAPQHEANATRNGNNRDVICINNSPTGICDNTKWNTIRPPFPNNTTPVIKDVVVVPAQGYTVIRFRANNPGLWLMHCHLDIHAHQGMAIILNEASGQHPKLPKYFPTCDEYEQTYDEYNSNNVVSGVMSKTSQKYFLEVIASAVVWSLFRPIDN